jgi:hypothetical protein
MTQPGLAAFGPLARAELLMVAGLATGIFDRVGAGGVPVDGDEDRRVRAELIRALLLGGPDMPTLHEKGLRLGGAWITGILDLEGCRVPRDIGLLDCRFEQVPVLLSAVIDTLSFDGSVLPGLSANRIEARGDLLFRAATLTGPVTLRGAKIGGDVVFDGAMMTAPGDMALSAARASVRGGAMFRGAVVQGGIALSGARIGVDLDLIGAQITQTEGPAIEATSIMVEADLDLRRAEVSGPVVLVSARIGGDCDLGGASFAAPGATAVNLNRARITGALFLREGAKVSGALSLNGAEIGALVDDPDCWPAKGELMLNRCRYGAILGSPVSARVRLDWLDRQTPEKWGEDFWPQPYEQLARVLGEMGHDEEKNRVLIAKERLQRRARRARASSLLTRLRLRLTDGLLWLTTGYGRLPLLALVWIFLLWAAGAVWYTVLDHRNALRPNSPVVLRSPEWVLCGIPATETVFLPSVGQDRQGRAAPGQPQLACFREQPEAAAFPKFSAAMLSADAVILGLGTGQKDTWSPDTRVPIGYWGKVFIYFQTLAGLALGLLAVAGFSGIVKSN